MTTMLPEHRRALLGSTLRILKTAIAVTPGCLLARSDGDTWEAEVRQSAINSDTGWDGNRPFLSAQGSMLRTLLSGYQHGVGLYELSRSSRDFSVALATLTRAVIEAYARVYWMITAPSPIDLVVRHATLEYQDLRYPVQHDLKVRRTTAPTPEEQPVVEYRAMIVAFLAKHDLRVSKHGITEMAEELMSEVYSESMVIYSGLAAAAHGYGWATSNFFSFAENDLRPDDQMLIEYHAYVVETTVVVVDRLVDAFRPEPPLRERWEQERDRVLMTLGWFIHNRDVLASKDPT